MNSVSTVCLLFCSLLVLGSLSLWHVPSVAFYCAKHNKHHVCDTTLITFVPKPKQNCFKIPIHFFTPQPFTAHDTSHNFTPQSHSHLLQPSSFHFDNKTTHFGPFSSTQTTSMHVPQLHPSTINHKPTHSSTKIIKKIIYNIPHTCILSVAM